MGDGKALAHGYRTLQHWDHWLAQQFLGNKLLETEERVFSHLLQKHFGKHVLLIGVPHQYPLLSSTLLPCHSLITPFISQEKKSCFIEGDFHELPIMTGSVDLVMLPHTLELVDNPRQLLSEACRVIKPEGLIILCGFNPYSLWGVKKLFGKHKTIPWTLNFLRTQKVKKWLQLADFVMEKHTSTLFTPPLDKASLYNKFHFMEYVGKKCFPTFGGIYILVARAKVIPLTPIRLKWKQPLSGIRISTSITGKIATNLK